MEDMIPCSLKDQEVFQRVWQRVMAGRPEADCPIQSGPSGWEGDLSCQCLEDLMHRRGEGVSPACARWEEQSQPVQPEGPEETAPAPVQPEPPAQEPAPEPPAPEAPAPEAPAPEVPAPEPSCPCSGPAQGLPEAEGPHRNNDMPRLWEEPQPADDRTARLRRHVMEALEGWQFYRHLARRTRGADQRALNAMAGELHRHARKLSAAYFLLTGLRYWPSELLAVPAIPSYWGALRTRHQAEQRQEGAFHLAQDDWEDPDLLSLYGELIEGCQHRCHQLRGLLERDDT